MAASREVYTMKEFMEIISIQEQTCFQKSRYEQSRRHKRKQKEKEEVDDDDEEVEHPLVTEMFGELYFRESPTSTLEGLFSPPRIDSRAAAPELPAAEPPEKRCRPRRRRRRRVMTAALMIVEMGRRIKLQNWVHRRLQINGRNGMDANGGRHS